MPFKLTQKSNIAHSPMNISMSYEGAFLLKIISMKHDEKEITIFSNCDKCFLYDSIFNST